MNSSQLFVNTRYLIDHDSNLTNHGQFRGIHSPTGCIQEGYFG